MFNQIKCQLPIFVCTLSYFRVVYENVSSYTYFVRHKSEINYFLLGNNDSVF